MSRRRISPDPSPTNPFMLAVATGDTSHNSVYLTRPCQYVLKHGKGVNNCTPALWTDARYNDVVMESMSEAIDWALSKKQRREVILVGGSGGALVSLQIAARRKDIKAVITLAELLHHGAWTEYHNLSPLRQSSDTPEIYGRIMDVEQVHVMGDKDDIIPDRLTRNAISQMKRFGIKGIEFRLVRDFDHQYCWADYWRQNTSGILAPFM